MVKAAGRIERAACKRAEASCTAMIGGGYASSLDRRVKPQRHARARQYWAGRQDVLGYSPGQWP